MRSFFQHLIPWAMVVLSGGATFLTIESEPTANDFTQVVQLMCLLSLAQLLAIGLSKEKNSSRVQ